MMLMFSSRVALAILALGSVFSCDASAGVVVSISAQGNSGLGDDPGIYNYDSGQITDSQSASTSRMERAGGTVSAAQVSANLVPGQLDPGLRLRTYARAENNHFGPGPRGDALAETFAAAQWGDTIRISNANPSPDHLAVTFSIRGEYGYTRAPRISEVSMGMEVVDLSRLLLAGFSATAVNAMNDGLAFNTFPRSVMNIRRGSWIGDGDQDSSDFYSLKGAIATAFFAIEPFTIPPGSSVFNEEVTGAFGWQQTLFAPYMAEIGGYNLNMAVISYSSAYQNGSAGIDAWNTITLDSVKFVDGTEISGPVVFDSGFSIAAVPEPSSLLLLCSGSLTYAIFRRRKGRLVC